MAPFKTILVLDDDPAFRKRLKATLSSQGYKVIEADTGADAVEQFNAHPDICCALLDIRVPDMSGLDVAEKIIDINAAVPVILITAYGDVPDAVAAVKKGVYDYLQKPIDKNSLLFAVRKAVSYNLTQQELERYKEDSLSRYQMVGQSDSMKKVYSLIDRVGCSDCTVLITGDTGAGKELVARAIHNKSDRRHKKMIKVNCAGIPDSLAEAELFGSEKGAYTSSYATRQGKLAIADKSTLFLDEIGELSLAVQAKFLHFLDNHTIQRVGSNRDIYVDTRIVAATNRNLEERVRNGEFRQDLLYRIKVVEIHVPPLSQRMQDVPLMLDYFIETFSEEKGMAKPKLSVPALNFLRNYSWPGNVRELRNLVDHICSLYPGQEVDIGCIRPVLTRSAVQKDEVPDNLKEATAMFQRDHILSILEQTEHNVSEAARRLGSDRANLYRKLKLMGLR